jgi:putative intracellular protease/amidase/uncharacterized protein (DUF952 family)
MRWLYHLRQRGQGDGERYAPPGLSTEGFVHASYRDAVAESARLHFPEGVALEVLRIDPRRLDAPVEVATTPRGEMPHIHGSIPVDAIREKLAFAHFMAGQTDMPDKVTGTRFAFVAFAGITLLDLVGVLDPISRIATMGFDPTSEREIIAAQEGPLRLIPASAGPLSLIPPHGDPLIADSALEVRALRTRPPLETFDVVIVPGGPGTRKLARDAAVVAWLASFPHNRLMASVCTGALVLGAAGRLRGKRATTHHMALEKLADHGATAVAERVVDEGSTVTAGGVTSAIDLGLHLVRRLVSVEASEAIARQMEYPPPQ